MSEFKKPKLSRRNFLGTTVAAAAGGLVTPALAQTEGTTEIEDEITEVVRRNISSFRSLNWRPYFST